MKRQFLSMVMLAICTVATLVGQQANADILWNNEVNNGLGMVLVTHPGGMTGAVAGADRSAIAVGTTTFGAGVQLGSNNRMADSFTVGGLGWNIDSLQFFAYQSFATTSTITGINVRIWSGDPGLGDGTGGTVAWSGGLFDGSNGMTTALSNIYRTTNPDTANTDRRIQTIDVTGLNVNLAPGTYHLDWSVSGTAASGPWAPVLGLPGATGAVSGGSWQSLANGAFAPSFVDGAAATIRGSNPFVINGTAIPEPGTLSILALGAVVGMLRRRK